MLAIKNLRELDRGPGKVLNFTRKPLKYAVQKDGWILYDNTGLKGDAAEWAREWVDSGRLEAEGWLQRVHTPRGESPVPEVVGECTKVVYAIGFERNGLPEIVVEGSGAGVVSGVVHDPHSGRISEGLFGIGIAFPELRTDPEGNVEHAVGLWKFMQHAKNVVGKT